MTVSEVYAALCEAASELGFVTEFAELHLMSAAESIVEFDTFDSD